ncbi:hypothetical protein RNZ50_17250 [Paracoccaceae bacterium Fryx2]|nr:hypothetical protein [Paracoccaceae bacterium Fryx2]
MQVIAGQRLVFLEMPKTASKAVVAMLKPHVSQDPGHRATEAHIGHRGFSHRWQRRLERDLGGPVETFCVMREPLERLQSWYRYRMRAKIAGGDTSTRGVDFNAFVAACIVDAPPGFARIGRQDRFLGLRPGAGPGLEGARLGVDHVFDYRRIGVLVDFVSERLGQRLVLPLRNVSPAPPAPVDYTLSDAVRAQVRAHLAAEFELYSLLRLRGVLHRVL